MRPLRIQSCGAGVQSTALAVMSTVGEIEPFDHVIFSDTGWEPPSVYAHWAKLKAHLEDHGVTVHEVTAGNIRTDHAAPTAEHLFIRKPRKYPELLGKQRTFMPFYVTTPEGEGERYLGDSDEDEVVEGKRGMTRRTCTKTYKVEPVERRIRDILGLTPRQRWPLEHVVDQIMGISWDESERMADDPRPAIKLCYPLVDGRITRANCTEWLEAHGWPDVPRSACVGCPFHDNDEWRAMRDERPDEWADAVEFDVVFRSRVRSGITALNGIPYLHAQRIPLSDVDLETPDDGQMSLFGEECAGFCGT